MYWLTFGCLSLSVVGWLVFVLRGVFVDATTLKHKACLQNIDHLERELFPEWFPKPKPQPTQIIHNPYSFELKPGMKLIVPDPSAVYYAQSSACARVPVMQTRQVGI